MKQASIPRCPPALNCVDPALLRLQEEKDGEKHGAKKAKEGEARAGSAGKANSAANEPADQDDGGDKPAKKAKSEHASTDQAPAAKEEDIKVHAALVRPWMLVQFQGVAFAYEALSLGCAR